MKENDFELKIRKLIKEIIYNKPEFQILEFKSVVDIVICRNTKQNPKLYFIEVKYATGKKGRINIGSPKGVGIQPEILKTKPEYFLQNMKWILGQEKDDKIYILDTNKATQYIAGKGIGVKQNNLQNRLFEIEEGLSTERFKQEIKKWFKIR